MENNKFADKNCFGCSETNPCGLGMKFSAEEKSVFCEWLPERRFEGYKNVLHGGIQATLMDETAAKFVNMILNSSGVTSKMEISFLRPVFIDGNAITIKAELIEMVKKVALIKTYLYNSEGLLCSESVVSYYTIPKDKLKEQILSKFPDKKSLLE